MRGIMGCKGLGKWVWIVNVWEILGYKKWESKSLNIVKYDCIYIIIYDVIEWMDIYF